MVVCKISPEYSVNVRKFVIELDFVAIFDHLDKTFLGSCLFFAALHGI